MSLRVAQHAKDRRRLRLDRALDLYPICSHAAIVTPDLERDVAVLAAYLIGAGNRVRERLSRLVGVDDLVDNAEHERESGGLTTAVELGVIDEIIDPDKTRQALVLGCRLGLKL